MNEPIASLLYLDTRLRTLLLRAIIARWQAGEREITSADLYAQLIEAGEAIPIGAMAVVFDNLRARKLIRGRLPENATATTIHGDTRINWLHPGLLTQADEA